MNPYAEAAMWWIIAGLVGYSGWLWWEMRHAVPHPNDAEALDEVDRYLNREADEGVRLIARDKAAAEWKAREREGQK